MKVLMKLPKGLIYSTMTIYNERVWNNNYDTNQSKRKLGNCFNVNFFAAIGILSELFLLQTQM